MFGWKKTPPIRTLVGEGTVVSGELRFTDGLRIDGEVHGDVTAAGEGRTLLVISEKARVHGKVTPAMSSSTEPCMAPCWPTACWSCSPRPASWAT